MAEVKPTASAVVEQEEQKKAAAEAVASYLQSPRKKRKTYVVLAFGQNLDYDLARNILDFVKRKYPKMAFSVCRTTEEFQRNFSRKIGLVVVNDEFTEPTELMKTIKELKKRKKVEGVPVLFLTRDPDRLLAAYHKKLLPYHEMDEFIPYKKMTYDQIISRIAVGIEQQNRRRSRRFKIYLPIHFDHIRSGERLKAQIVDLSAHGATIQSERGDFIFQIGDQVRLMIPILKIISPGRGDFFHLSGIVKRVFISANMAALSFEHINDVQFTNLLKLITGVVRGKVPAKKPRSF